MCVLIYEIFEEYVKHLHFHFLIEPFHSTKKPFSYQHTDGRRDVLLLAVVTVNEC